MSNGQPSGGGNAAQGICKPGTSPTTMQCQKKHWVKVRLKHRDDKTDVPAAACEITLGGTEIAPGPLAGGVLEAHNLDPGSYEVSFPDIDASEWAKG